MTVLNGPVIIITAVAVVTVPSTFIRRVNETGNVSNWEVEGNSVRSSSYFPFLWVPEHPRESLWPSSVWPPQEEVVADRKLTGLRRPKECQCLPHRYPALAHRCQSGRVSQGPELREGRRRSLWPVPSSMLPCRGLPAPGDPPE